MCIERDPAPDLPVVPDMEEDEGYAWNYYGRDAVPDGGDAIRPPRRRRVRPPPVNPNKR